MTIFTRGHGPVDTPQTAAEWDEHLDFLDHIIGDPADHDTRADDGVERARRRQEVESEDRFERTEVQA